ncbi:MAG: hypothetical protein IV100_31125 [Myxococcales bacterium]|nr:hypothetical protein [Myxococcales bacterium]
MTTAPGARGPIATAMAAEHLIIAGLVDAASECLLLPSGAIDGLARAAVVTTTLRRHVATEERLLFGRPVDLDGAHAEHHLTRDHGLIASLLQLIDEPTGDSLTTRSTERRPLHVLAALRRLHHLLEHHDQREVAGICAAIDASLSRPAAAAVADELRRGLVATEDAVAPGVADGDDVHPGALRLASAAPGSYADTLWRVAVDGGPLVLPRPSFPSSERRRPVDAACVALDALLDAAGGRITMAAFDQALRVDRLVARTGP